MAEFKCANCGAPLEVDDAQAGNKVQCPDCQHVQDVPGLKLPPISFLCNNCGADLQVSALSAGKMLNCSHCGCMVLVPPLKAKGAKGGAGCLGVLLLGAVVAGAALSWLV